MTLCYQNNCFGDKCLKEVNRILSFISPPFCCLPLVKFFSSLFYGLNLPVSWCTGKTQRDGMEREAGGGIGMGNTCRSMADSCQCMAKTTTIL